MTEIHPVDLEALRRNPPKWDIHYVTSVLCELVSRQRGYQIDFKLPPRYPGGEEGVPHE